MASGASILQTYGDVAIKEDVLRDIEILTATENFIHNMLGKTTAISTIHNTLYDTLDTVTSASYTVAENADYSNTALTTPSRFTNLIEIIAKKFEVSRTQQQVEHYHGQDELSRQVTKAMKDWMNYAERQIVRGSLTSGQSSTAPKMNGIIMGISKSTTYTAQTSGTIWSASIFRGLMKNCWDNSNGDVATDVFMGSYLKNETDSFGNKSNVVNTGLNVREIVNVVDVFETGLGKVRVYPHRYVQISGTDATGRVLGINPDKIKIAYLKRTFIDTGLQRAGDYDPRAVVGKLTTEIRNQNSNFFASGYLI